MDLAILDKRMKEYCEQHMDRSDFRLICRLKLILYDEGLRKAIFPAEDLCELHGIGLHYSNELVAALESVTGQPSYVECRVRREIPKPIHKRFTIGVTE